MPRVKSSDGLYKPMTDKMLPQLPQLEMVPENTPEATITSTIRKVSSDTITEEDESHEDISDVSLVKEVAANTIKDMSLIPTETIPYAESAWQEFHVQDAKVNRQTLSKNLQTAIDQIKSHLISISISNTRYNCLMSLLESIAETNKSLQSHHQHAVDQHHALFQKETQLVNASNFVLEQNDVLINKCRMLLSDTTNSCHELQIACGQALAHAKESSIAQQDNRIPKPDDSGKELETLMAFNKDVKIVIDNVMSINELLANHKCNVDVQVTDLKAEIITFASKRSSGTLRKMLCFR